MTPEIQSLLSSMLGVVLAFFAFLKYINTGNNKLHDRINSTKDKFASEVKEIDEKYNKLSVHIPETYVRKEELLRIESKMDNMEERILRAIRRGDNL